MSARNIMRLYQQATPEDHAAGLAWYMKANAACERISKREGLPVYIVAGVVAALSPNNRWERNLVDAENLIHAYVIGAPEDSVNPCTYKAMRAKAWRILEELPEDASGVATILNGQKIKSFFSNIMGLDDLTIDGHARNIYYNERINLTDNRTNIGVKEYRFLQDEYRKAAKKLGVAAHVLQAVTWTTWRRIHAIG